MKKSLAIVLVFFTLNTVIAQLPAGINMLRYNDNFAYLMNDSVVKKGHEKLKMIPLRKNALLYVT
jgi:hypothetical protein